MKSFHIIVRVADQELDFFRKSERLRTYPISTASKGIGCEIGSNKTPFGKLKVAQKIGADAPIGAVFKSRLPTGEVWSRDPSNPLADSTEDLILTRILWLEGVEAANANTMNRYIYIHGTNQEHLLRQPVSHGCIRMGNHHIVDLFSLTPIGCPVFIVTDSLQGAP